MDKPAIAMCCDMRGQTGDIGHPDRLIGSDDLFKIKQMGKANVLLAGSFPKASELAIACRGVIRYFTNDPRTEDEMDFDLSVTDLITDLRAVATKKKAELIRNFVTNNTGIDHAEFVKLSSDNHIGTWSEIRRLTLGADILICHVGSAVALVRLDRFGEPHWEHNYGAIGDGSDVARAFLCLQPWIASQRDDEYYMKPVPLVECLYRLYEAKCAAHKANPSSVGEATSFQVLSKDGRTGISPEMWGALDDAFRRKHRVPDIAKALKPDASILRGFQPFGIDPIGSDEVVK
jgi:hypothetical protein